MEREEPWSDVTVAVEGGLTRKPGYREQITDKPMVLHNLEATIHELNKYHSRLEELQNAVSDFLKVADKCHKEVLGGYSGMTDASQRLRTILKNLPCSAVDKLSSALWESKKSL